MTSEPEYYRRTAITRLDGLSQQDHDLLHATVEEWLDGCNIASNLAWENKHTQFGVRSVAKDTVQRKTEAEQSALDSRLSRSRQQYPILYRTKEER
jgi:putative transposase